MWYAILFVNTWRLYVSIYRSLFTITILIEMNIKAKLENINNYISINQVNWRLSAHVCTYLKCSSGQSYHHPISQSAWVEHIKILQ